MSVLDTPLGSDQLKAPVGHFRVVKMRMRLTETELKPEAYFLVEDFGSRSDALQRQRELLDELRGIGINDFRYGVRDDQGHVVDALGTHITDAERKAPEGKFRVIYFDSMNRASRLVTDIDDRDEATEYAKEAGHQPYMWHEVYDDAGACVLSLG